ncbi:fot5 transposase [Fusarium oxysporum f. sp. phaseoli]
MANRLLTDCNALPVGKNWASNFVKRHTELKICFFRKYNSNIIAKYSITLADIYNFDETGFIMGIIASGMVVIGTDRRGRPKLV